MRGVDIDRADELADKVSRGVADGREVNELLSQFFSGYPLDKLRPLLHSQSKRTAEDATWLASELGSLGASLLDEVPRLLGHPLRGVRFDALDVVLVNATADHGALLADAVLLISDPDRAVRWQALQFLARATDEQLAASVSCQREEGTAALTAWLLGPPPPEEIIARLKAPGRLTRSFAAVATARTYHLDPMPLQRAAEATDREVSTFADDWLAVTTTPPR